MRVTDAKGWLALAAVALLLAAAVTWGMFGKVPNKVTASGVLIPAGGLADVVAMADGQLAALEVAPGDLVQKGQVVARIAQPELIAQIEGAAKSRRAISRWGCEKNKEMGSEDARLRSQASAQDRATLRANMDATVQRTKELQERLVAQEDLLAQGLVTKDSVQGTQQQLRLAEATLKGAQADMQRVTLSSFSAQRANEGALREDRLRAADAQRQIKLLEDKLAGSTAVVSPDTGRIVELRAAAGDVVRNGMAIASLERAGAGLEALLYVDSREGKLVRPGMFVEVAPSVVRRERHGAHRREGARGGGFPRPPAAA